MSARMGIYQEVIYGKYGKHPKEALFYTHALPLPGISTRYPDRLKYHAENDNYINSSEELAWSSYLDPELSFFVKKFELYLVTQPAYFGTIFTFVLLGFLLLAPDILHHWNICLNSAPLALPLVNLQV